MSLAHHKITRSISQLDSFNPSEGTIYFPDLFNILNITSVCKVASLESVKNFGSSLKHDECLLLQCQDLIYILVELVVVNKPNRGIGIKFCCAQIKHGNYMLYLFTFDSSNQV